MNAIVSEHLNLMSTRFLYEIFIELWSSIFMNYLERLKRQFSNIKTLLIFQAYIYAFYLFIYL